MLSTPGKLQVPVTLKGSAAVLSNAGNEGNLTGFLPFGIAKVKAKFCMILTLCLCELKGL
jgi:hypothetical protein